jgi:hypothetical protein
MDDADAHISAAKLMAQAIARNALNRLPSVVEPSSGGSQELAMHVVTKLSPHYNRQARTW